MQPVFAPAALFISEEIRVEDWRMGSMMMSAVILFKNGYLALVFRLNLWSH
jgi:hypothetical protein